MTFPKYLAAPLLLGTDTGIGADDWNDLMDALNGVAPTGDLIVGGTFKIKNGGSFAVQLAHSATANRTVTIPDQDGTMAILERAQTWTQPQTISESGTEGIFSARRTDAGPVGIEFGSNNATGGSAYFDWHVVSGNDYDVRMIRNSGTTGAFDIIQTGTGGFRLYNSSTLLGSLASNGAFTINSTVEDTLLLNRTSAGNLAIDLRVNHASGGTIFLDFNIDNSTRDFDARIQRTSGQNGTFAFYNAGSERFLFSGAGFSLASTISDTYDTSSGLAAVNPMRSAVTITATSKQGDGTAVNYAHYAMASYYRATTLATTGAEPFDLVFLGLNHDLVYGNDDGAGNVTVAATGTLHNTTRSIVVKGSGTPKNEIAIDMAWMRVDNGQQMSHWFTDWSMHGPINVRPGMFNGINLLMNNHFNGQPQRLPDDVTTVTYPSGMAWFITYPKRGAATETSGHRLASTYKLDVGVGIVGAAGINDGAGNITSYTRGFEVGLQIGGYGSGWMSSSDPSSKIGTGISIKDVEDYGILISDPAVTTASSAVTALSFANATRGYKYLIDTSSALVSSGHIKTGTALSIYTEASGSVVYEIGSQHATGGAMSIDMHTSSGDGDYSTRIQRGSGADGIFSITQTGVGGFRLFQSTAGAVGYEIGSSSASGGSAFIDWHISSGDGDYSFREIRNSGTNGAFDWIQTGTGPMRWYNGATLIMSLDNAGLFYLGANQRVILSESGQTGAHTFTFPNATDTLVGLATSQAITGKTYNGLTVSTTTGTLTVTNSKTLTVSDSMTLATNSVTFAGAEVLTLAAAKNVTFADAFATSGSFSVTLTATGATNVTLPTSGTLATLAGSEIFTNKTYSGGTFQGSFSTNGITITSSVEGAFAVKTNTAGQALGIELGNFEATTGGTVYIDFHAIGNNDYETRLQRGQGTNGNFVIFQTGTGAIRISSAQDSPFELFNNASVTDGLLLNSLPLLFSGRYDSDATAGVTAATYSFRVINTMTAGGASPAGRLSFKNHANTELYAILSTGHIAIAATAKVFLDGVDGAGDTYLTEVSANVLDAVIGGNVGLELSAPADGETALLLRRNVGGSFTLQRVSMGAADSGGTGYKLLRVAN